MNGPEASRNSSSN